MPRPRRPFVVNGDPVEIDAPGLEIQDRHDVELRWRATQDAIKHGYQPKSVRLTTTLAFRLTETAIHIIGERAEFDRLAARCRELTLEMLDWLGDPAALPVRQYTGTLASLVDLFKSDPESAYNTSNSPNTRRGYDDWCRPLVQKFGERRVDKLTGRDMRRWFQAILEPARPEAPPRLVLARRCVKVMMPILLAYGMEVDLPGCAALRKVLVEIDIRVSAEVVRRWRAMRVTPLPMTAEHAEAIIAEGLRRGTVRHRSVALGVAAQFEFMFSQIDLVGLYQPIAPGTALPAAAVTKHAELWDGGLRYQHFLPDMILDTRRHKTGRPGVYDVREYPLFMKALAAVPEAERAGPVVVDDDGLPMTRFRYSDLYREITDAAGVPREVWNMKARNGGASEASDSGATDEEVANHLRNDPETARGFYIHASITQSRKVARLRVADRQKKKAQTP